MNQSAYPKRKSPHLNHQDYSEDGTYFVTICTNNRYHLFGDVYKGEMMLNAYGHLATACWLFIPYNYEQVQLDHYVVMPNHIHGMVILDQGKLPVEKRYRIEHIITAYRAAFNHQINELDTSNVGYFWQEQFHNHLIKNEVDWNRIREYVLNNPKLWEQDTFYTR